MKPGNTPQIRFPGFTKDWRSKPLKSIANKLSERNNTSKSDVVLTNSAIRGIILQTDFFEKEIAVQGNLSNYYSVALDDFIYNPRISSKAPVGPFKRNHYGSGVMSPLYTVYRFNSTENLDYFEQYFSSSKWHAYMRQVANYGVRHDRMAVSSDDLNNLPIPYPDAAEQKKISDFFVTFDKKIEKMFENIQHLHKYKKSLVQKILNQEIRFKSEDQIEYPPWKNTKLDDVLLIENGFPFKSAMFNNKGEGERLVRIRDLKSGHPKTYFSGEYDDRYLVNNDDVLIGMDGGFNLVHWKQGRALLNQRVLRLKPKSNNSVDYLAYFIETQLEEIERKTPKTTVKHLSNKDLLNIHTAIPVVEEQIKIASFLQLLDQRIIGEENRLNATKKLKSILLEKMFA